MCMRKLAGVYTPSSAPAGGLFANAALPCTLITLHLDAYIFACTHDHLATLDRANYIEPLLRAADKGQLGRCHMACVFFSTRPPYRFCIC